MLTVLSPYQISFPAKKLMHYEITLIKPEAGCSPGIFSLQYRH